jgi:hypothetical protein
MAGAGGAAVIEIDPQTGLPVVRVGRRVTQDDVQAAQDEG